MNPPRVFRVGLPGDPTLRVRPRAAPQRRGLGDYPGRNGGPGSQIWPYSENALYGDGSNVGPSGNQVITDPPLIGTPPTPMSETAQSVISTPFGESEREWFNPTTYATVPIIQAVPAAMAGSINQSPLPILSLNYRRNSLIIQNTSTATAPDFAPTVYIGFNVQPQVNGALALVPGLGFYWSASDCPPRDSIFIVFGPFDNTNSTVVVGGCVIQGTYDPIQRPVVMSNMGGGGSTGTAGGAGF